MPGSSALGETPAAIRDVAKLSDCSDGSRAHACRLKCALACMNAPELPNTFAAWANQKLIFGGHIDSGTYASKGAHAMRHPD